MYAPKTRLRVLAIMSGTTVLGRDFVAEPNISQLEALAARGHKVTCIAPSNHTLFRRKSAASSFTLQTILFRKTAPILPLLVFQLHAVWRLLRSIGRYDAIILHVYSVPLAFPILIVARKWTRFPAIVLKIPTNPVETGGFLRSLIIHWIYGVSLKLAATLFDKILFTTPMMGDLYSTQLHIPKNKIGVWPASLNLRLFDPAHVNKTNVRNLRKKLGLSDRLSVLYIGTLSRNRGLMETIQSMEILKKRCPLRLKLVLLGNGPWKEIARKYVKGNDLEETVFFCGPVKYSQVPCYIAACDVGLNPYPDNPWWRYQSPTKVLEYLAMKKPVIVSDIPAHRWIIGRAPVALFLKTTTAQAIADGIVTFAFNRKKFHPQAGRRISSRFSTENTAEMLESEIQRHNV